MLFEILSLAGGAVTRLLPEVFGALKARRENDHEYRMTQLQLQIDQARATQAIDLAHAQASIAQAQADMAAMVEALRSANTPTGIPLVDAVNSTVRPFLTYWWCVVLYTAAKVIQIVVATQGHADLASFAGIVMTEFDRSCVGSIIGFWFVDRSLRKAGRAA